MNNVVNFGAFPNWSDKSNRTLSNYRFYMEFEKVFSGSDVNDDPRRKLWIESLNREIKRREEKLGCPLLEHYPFDSPVEK